MKGKLHMGSLSSAKAVTTNFSDLSNPLDTPPGLPKGTSKDLGTTFEDLCERDPRSEGMLC